MRTIIAGSRSTTQEQFNEGIALCTWLDEITVVISGTAQGADVLGEQWAKSHGLEIERYPADWAEHGRAAGPIRNRLMAENADALIAIWDGTSRGTKNMFETARDRGLRIHIHTVQSAHQR